MTRRLLATTLAATVICTAMFAATQPRMDGVGNDGGHYLTMAAHFKAGTIPSADEPFVVRVLVPYIAAQLSSALDLSLEAAFLWLNVVAGVIAALLFVYWLSRHVGDANTCLAVLLMFLVTPYGPARLTFYYPVLTDQLAMVFLLAGLIAIDALRERATYARAVVIGALIFLGCLCREVMLVIAIAMQFAMPWRSDPVVWAARLLALAAAAAGMMIPKLLVIPTASGYSLIPHLQYWWTWKTAPQMVLALAFTFGPSLALLAVQARCVLRDCRRRPDWLIYCAAIVVLSWIGGSDTERILQYGLPPVLMFVARALERVPTRAGFVIVVIAQLVAYRVGVSIGGLLAATPADAVTQGVRGVVASLGAHDGFFSFFLPRPWLITFLVVHVTLWIVIAATRSLTSSPTCINVKSIDA